MIFIIGIFLVAAILRLWQVREPLWIDELHTSWTVAESLSEVSLRARLGNQSSPYFIAAWLSTHLAGQSELTLRLPSLIAGLALIPTAFLLTVRWTKREMAGHLAALLIAINPTCIFYAQEARPYALVQWLGLLQLNDWLRGFGIIGESSVSYAARWASLSIVMFFVHYTTGLLIGSEMLLAGFVLLFFSTKPINQRITLGLILLIPIVGAILAWPHLKEILEYRHQWNEMLGDVDWSATATTVPGWPMLLAAALFALVARMIDSSDRDEQSQLPRLLGALVLIVIVPVAIAWFTSRTGIAPLLHCRYLIVSATILPIATASMTARLKTNRQQWSCAMSVVALAVLLSPIPSQWIRENRFLADRNEDWPGLVAAINRSHSKGQTTGQRAVTSPIVLCANLVEDERLRDRRDRMLVQYLRFPLQGLYRLSSDEQGIIPAPTHGSDRFRLVSRILRASGARDTKSAPPSTRRGTSLRRVWLVVRTKEKRLVDEIELDFATSIQAETAGRESFGDLWLMEFRFETTSEPPTEPPTEPPIEPPSSVDGSRR